VFLLIEENRGFGEVIGNPSMPFLNSLATSFGVATQYFANAHPSIGNYFQFVCGQTVTNDDNFAGSVSADNLVRQLNAAGKTWKSYAEDIPSPGFLGVGTFGQYASRHNPVVYLTDVTGSPAQAQNVVPFSQLAADMASSSLPQFGLIVPNLCDDGHDCPSSTADAWLQTNIAPLIADPVFQQDGLLIITFDEAADTDTALGGGRVAWIAVSPAHSRTGFTSTTLYQHESTLRLVLQGLGVSALPGAAATAPDMTEFFQTP
jgi:acid phosphatase